MANNDLDKIEYVETIEMEILKPGKINWWEATEEMLREVASSYDPEVLRAPLVVDHKMEGPAYGHVLSLKAVDQKDPDGDLVLIGKVGLLQEGKDMIESGAWNERSVYLSDVYPFYGIWYLKHLSLLGAANPASPGMAPVILIPDEASLMEEEIEAMTPELQEMYAQDMLAIWEKTDEFIHYRVRPSNRFQEGTLRTVLWSEAKGIKAIMGKLKSQYVTDDSKKGKQVVQSVMFNVDKKWTMPKAKTWVKANKDKLKAAVEDVNDLMGVVEDAEVDSAVDKSSQAGGKAKMGDTTEKTSTATADDGKGQEEKGQEVQGKEGNAETTTKPDPADGQKQETASSDVTASGRLDESGRPKSPEKVLEEEQAIYAHQRLVDQELAEAEAETLAYKARMQVQAKVLKTSRIRTKVQNMLASGFLVPSQLEAGLIQALEHIPKGAKVGEKEALDVILDCLAKAGKLMLKDQIAHDVVIDETGPDSDLDHLVASGFKGTGIEVERERRKILAEAQKKNEPLGYVEALRIAQERVAKRGGEVH